MSTRRKQVDPPLPPGRRQRKRDAQRARIRRVALRLFAKHGYDAVSVASITDAADVAKGTFFNYFPTKADILVSFWAEVAEDVLAYGESLMPNPGQDGFRRFFNYFARRVERDGEIFDELVCQVAYLPALREVEKAVVNRTKRLYTQLLAARQIVDDRELDLIIQVIRDMWVGTLRQWVFSGHDFSLGRRMNRKLELFLGR